MIVVIDSSTWISAMEFGGTPASAIERAILVGRMATCDEIDSEVIRTLCKKFRRDPMAVRDRLGLHVGDAVRVEITGEVSGVCRDPNDDCILECALKAGAEFIVTGDNDLLTLGEYRGIRIVTARQYLELTTQNE